MHWNLNPILLHLGPLELRWYGLFFATGLYLAARACTKNFDVWGLPRTHAERLTLWVPIGMILGAHYIHLIFYEQEGLFDIWPPIQFEPNGTWHFGRFWALGSGLASHGGGLGCFIALGLFFRRHAKTYGYKFHRYLDALMVSSIWVYPFVRLGNFANSEIVGRPTQSAFGVVFERLGETFARHPQQLYEAFGNFAILAFSIWWRNRYANKVRNGATFYLFILCYFSMRFCAEFTKELQIAEYETVLNMGHWLSLPPIILALSMLLFSPSHNLRTALTEDEQNALTKELELAQKMSTKIDGPLAAIPEAAATPSKSKKK